MKKLLVLLLLVLSYGFQAQTKQSITGKWLLAKVIKVDGISASKLKAGKQALEGNVILSFNENGTFQSTAFSNKEVKTWTFQKKTKTISIKGQSEKLKVKILNFKPTHMRVKMQLSRSVVGEFLLEKN